MSAVPYHIPVLRDACVEGLGVSAAASGPRVFVDVTFGGGGHSRAILDAMGPQDRLLGFDQDPEAAANRPDDSRFTFVAANFRHLRRFLRLHGVERCDGILADLGVSSHQLDAGERGFSTRSDAPLDMRMNPSEGVRSAAEVVRDADESTLARILAVYGEVDRPGSVARALIAARGRGALTTTGELVQALAPVAPRHREFKFQAQVFQALRIEVNDELGALRELLEDSARVLKPGGRLVVLAYHSLEDRLVKHFLRAGNFEDTQERDLRGHVLAPFAPMNRRALTASEDEIAANPRARSAKLRIATRTEHPAP
jgi:16S rRNA (cytosine1402-N4)-methyltransferase